MNLGAPPSGTGLHGPSLLVALAVMLGGTGYPALLADAAGRADHVLALAWLWAMSAGFVRGVGFRPHWPGGRLLLGVPGWLLALALAAWLRWGG